MTHARDWIDYWTFCLTAAGVVVLALYTYYAYRQSTLTKRSLELGRRAWIVINGAPRFKGAMGWTFEDVTIENVAEMPAVIQRCGTGSVDGEVTMLSPQNWQYIESGGVVVRGRPTSVYFPEVGPPPFDLHDPAGAFAAVGQTTIYCIVEYTDCFETTWSTTACWRQDRKGEWQFASAYPKLK